MEIVIDIRAETNKMESRKPVGKIDIGSLKRLVKLTNLQVN